MGRYPAEAQAGAAAGACSWSPRGWAGEASELQDRIRYAQLQAGRPGTVTPQSLLGNWTDSYGNAVRVRATDSYSLHLTATLARPPRPDIHLKFRPVDTGAGWLCGEAILDATLGPAGGQPTQLFWCFPSGDVSVWVKKEAPGSESVQDALAGGSQAWSLAEEQKMVAEKLGDFMLPCPSTPQVAEKLGDFVLPCPSTPQAAAKHGDFLEPCPTPPQAEQYVCVACVPQTAEQYVCVACVPQTVWVPQTFFVAQPSPLYLGCSPLSLHN